MEGYSVVLESIITSRISTTTLLKDNNPEFIDNTVLLYIFLADKLICVQSMALRYDGYKSCSIIKATLIESKGEKNS
jgi:hypothetical protein